ncbi:MAG: hypothetical protein ABIG11_01725 [bacterium]
MRLPKRKLFKNIFIKSLAILLTAALLPVESVYAVPAAIMSATGGNLLPGHFSINEKVLLFFNVRGEEYGIVIKDHEILHAGTAGIPGFGVLDERTKNRFLKIISEASSGETDAVLADALAERLSLGEAGQADLFLVKAGVGRFRVTSLGFKTFIEKLIREETEIAAPGIPAAAVAGEGGIPDVLLAMSESGGRDSGRFFDGSAKYGQAVPVDGVSSGEAGKIKAASLPAGKKLNGNLTVSIPKPSLNLWKPPDNAKGRAARVAGPLLAGAALGTVTSLFWGPAAAAYYLTGSLMKSAQYNSDVLGKIPGKLKKTRTVRFLGGVIGKIPGIGLVKKAGGAVNAKVIRPVLEYAKKHPGRVRPAIGAGLLVTGVFTGNPVLTYFGMTFGILGAGDMISKKVFAKTYDLLGKDPVKKLAVKIDGGVTEAAKKIQQAAYKIKNRIAGEKKEAADKNSAGEGGLSGKFSFLSRGLNKAGSGIKKGAQYIAAHRGQIARIGLAAAASMGIVGGFAFGTDRALANTLGKATMPNGEVYFMDSEVGPVKTLKIDKNSPGGEMSFGDKIRNILIGAYRHYNLSATVLKDGEQTGQFYAKMTAKYDPKTPAEWASIIEKEITYVGHEKIYGTSMYYISSEEAATLATINGITGRFSDCTGKAVLLINCLKRAGFAPSKLVVGVPRITNLRDTAHAWVSMRDAAGKEIELFHYSNTQDLLPSWTFKPVQGIKGNNTALFAGGGAGGLAAKGIYGLLDRIEKKIKNRNKKTAS